MDKFKLVTRLKPKGDQPQAIKKITDCLKGGRQYNTLLGVTGSGKTFTAAQVIAKLNKPALIISHNKTLAAQLYSEFKEFFPHNAVEYFVSYYDYYQPEAYIPHTDTYIEKDASINDRLDRLRLSATTSLMSRQDVIIVASVSCIYNLGSPSDYEKLLVFIEKGMSKDRDDVLRELVDIQYQRNDVDFHRGTFRVRGDVVEVFPAYEQVAVRIEFFGSEVERITKLDPISGKKVCELDKIGIYPAKHFVMSGEKIEGAIKSIEDEMHDRVGQLEKDNKLVEAQRLQSRTKYDMEMLKEVGYCHGIENYSRQLSGRTPGSRPYCLIDYFPDEFLTIIDESHVTVSQIGGMYEGDRARKEVLVEHGFRLPSCLDNRPLRFNEFEKLTGQTVFISATPAKYEIQKSKEVVEQIIRPTGLLDPEIIIKPTEGQVDDLIAQVRQRAKKKERVLVTTLTKRMSEDLCSYLEETGLRVKYLHSEIGAIERVEILRDLRLRKFDCLVGINLLREGLDLPEVSLVAILDADKEGFLRSQTSLIQVAGRAARNVNGQVIMYADTRTNSMKKAIEETVRRRKKQLQYNKTHSITPKTIVKAVRDGIEATEEARELVREIIQETPEEFEKDAVIVELEQEMELAARNLQFERAAELRDQIAILKKKKVTPKKKWTRRS